MGEGDLRNTLEEPHQRTRRTIKVETKWLKEINFHL